MVSYHFRGFDHVAGHIDHAGHDVLAGKQRLQIGRHMRVDAFQAHLVDAAPGQRRKHRFVRSHSSPKVFFPSVLALMP